MEIIHKEMNNPRFKQNFWIFQANPDVSDASHYVFDASHWWHDMQLFDQWQINKHHRDRVRKMGIEAMWGAMIDEDDVWLTKTQHREKIVCDGDLQAILLSERFDYWSVFEHKDEIRKGDMAAIWVAGSRNMAGIYAIVEIMTDPYLHPLPREGNIRYWVREKDRESLLNRHWRIVSIRYITIVDPPWAPLISRSTTLDDEILVDLIVNRFSEATNLGPVPAEQWQRIMELAGISFKHSSLSQNNIGKLEP